MALCAGTFVLYAKILKTSRVLTIDNGMYASAEPRIQVFVAYIQFLLPRWYIPSKDGSPLDFIPFISTRSKLNVAMCCRTRQSHGIQKLTNFPIQHGHGSFFALTSLHWRRCLWMPGVARSLLYRWHWYQRVIFAHGNHWGVAGTCFSVWFNSLLTTLQIVKRGVIRSSLDELALKKPEPRPSLVVGIDAE